MKDSLDINNGYDNVELCYEVSSMGGSVFNIKFSNDAWPNVKDATYVDSCRNGCSNLFGCISLRKKQYCILNKQYTKEEYEALVQKIIEQMSELPYTDSRGRVYRYGEFFPIELSPFAYNQSSATEYFPMTLTEVTDRGYRWGESTKRTTQPDLQSSELPDRVQDTDDSYLQKIIQCQHADASDDGSLVSDCQQQCTLVYKLMPGELGLRKELQLALPRLCPNCRHHERLARLQPYQTWQRKCVCQQLDHGHEGLCPNQFETSYPPESPNVVYCESCYQAEIV